MDGISEADLLKIHQMALEERQSTVSSLLNQFVFLILYFFMFQPVLFIFYLFFSFIFRQKLPEALAESLRKPPTGITDEKVKVRILFYFLGIFFLFFVLITICRMIVLTLLVKFYFKLKMLKLNNVLKILLQNK